MDAVEQQCLFDGGVELGSRVILAGIAKAREVAAQLRKCRHLGY